MSIVQINNSNANLQIGDVFIDKGVNEVGRIIALGNDGTARVVINDTNITPPNPIYECLACKKSVVSNGFYMGVDGKEDGHICSGCRDEYLNKNLEDFKKFVAIKKIQQGK